MLARAPKGMTTDAESRGRAIRRALWPTILLLLAGCQVCCPPVPEGFSRETPAEASRLMQHAAEIEAWDLIYCGLSEATRERVGWFEFSWGFPSQTFPNSDVKIVDILREMEFVTSAPRQDGGAVTIYSFRNVFVRLRWKEGLIGLQDATSEKGWLLAIREQELSGPTLAVESGVPDQSLP